MGEEIDANKVAKLISKLNKRLLFSFFLWLKLPAAWYSGVRLVQLDEQKAVAKIPYKRFTQNPFRSTYFACLSMAAELTTGIHALIAIQAATNKVSMLIVNNEGNYFKKATSSIIFTCADGEKIREAISTAIRTGEAVTLKCSSTGQNELGETVAQFYFTWSFKIKN